MEKINRNKFVIDIETLKGCFTYTGKNIDTFEIVQFVLHPARFELTKLINHLKICKGHITFNGLSFDYPIIHFILLNYNDWVWELNSRAINKKDVIDSIYTKAQEIISQQHNFGQSFGIKHSQILIPQLDLFRIWHYNNAARSQSLKGLQISMDYENVQDMPINHWETNISVEDIEDILKYNENDVISTYQFYLKSIDKINLRKGIQKKYGLKCINYPDSKIGESLILKMYCDKMELNPWDIVKMRTERPTIALKDCIPDYIRFKTKEFQSLLSFFQSKIITETKGAIEENVIFKGAKYVFGTGGLHQAAKPGVYESTNERVILDIDVNSMYPSIAIENKYYPEHLGIEFCDLYSSIVKQRLEAKKNKDMTLSDGLKLSANAIYGKSNDKHSFLFDPLYTIKTTLTGQLSLMMLIEKIVLDVPNIEIIQTNTDGVSFLTNRSELNKVYKICKLWESLTKLELEYVEYSKMVLKDVNNYISITYDGKIKYKGNFELVKDYHKNNSFKVITIALSEYFINNIPVEQTIRNHTNIYDFCGRQKFKSNSYGVTYELLMGDITPIRQQKNVRYYISKKGHKFIKHFDDGRQSIINEGCPVIIFNKFEQKDDYHIDYDYYIRKANEEIRNVVSNQLTLF